MNSDFIQEETEAQVVTVLDSVIRFAELGSKHKLLGSEYPFEFFLC